MNEHENDTGTHYVILIRRVLDPAWSPWFDDLTITTTDNDTTLLHGLVRDQTELYGIIGRLRDLGLALVSCAPDHDAYSGS